MRSYSLQILVAATALLSACGDDDAAASEVASRAARSVSVHVVRDEPLAPAVLATGTIAGKEEVPLSFKIGGLIARIAVDEGQRVSEGQVLAELSPTEIAALVARATEGRTKARRDLDRVRRLHNDSVATLTQLQDAATALEVAEQEVRGVEFNQSLSVIRAPAAGVILQRVAEPNAVVSPGATILTLRTERRGVILRAGLADRDAMRVRRGDPARITLDALPGEVLEGRVSQIAASASAQTGTFDVEIAISSSRRPLASGLIARAEIAVGASGTYAMLPLDAIVEASADSAVVFVVPDSADVAERRIVRLAQITGARAAVSSGIASGERVVVRGGAYLQDGSRVTIAAGKEPR